MRTPDLQAKSGITKLDQVDNSPWPRLSGHGEYLQFERRVWTIYEKPKGHPQLFVARRWVVAAQPVPTEDLFLADNLESLRAKLPAGLIRMPAMPGDDSVIVETWM